MLIRFPRCAALIATLALALRPVQAQHDMHDMSSMDSDSGWNASGGAQAIALVTRVDPARQGRALTEGYVAQPMLMGHLMGPRMSTLNARLTLGGTLNFEGVTMSRGELNPGASGEGYVDRRHPHTLFHEAFATLESERSVATSLTIGKGFASYGSDDPMVRGFALFPANHHLAQILERAIVVGAIRWRRAALEATLFNGDEPEGPYDWPNANHFFDSHAVRGTLWLGKWFEWQGSGAFVKSPENAFGGGLSQRKVSTSLRFAESERVNFIRSPYALIEWARNDDMSGSRLAFRYSTLLGEGGATLGNFVTLLRLERTTRPEDERQLDPFRSPRPQADNSILGITRFSTVTAHLELSRPIARLMRPFFEASYSAVSPTLPGSLFNPAVEVFGSDRLWTVSAGMRLSVGSQHSRMGRYGVAQLVSQMN